MALHATPTSNSGLSGAPSVAVPGGMAAGVRALLIGTIDTAGILWSAFWPAGFVHVTETSIGPDGQRVGVAEKILSGADSGNYACADMGVTRRWQLHCVPLSGRHASSPSVAGSWGLDASGSYTGGAISAPGVTALAGDDIVTVAALDGSGTVTDASWTMPDTELIDLMTTLCSMGISLAANVSAGATGAKAPAASFSAGTAGWAALQIRVPAVPTVPMGAIAAAILRQSRSL